MEKVKTKSENSKLGHFEIVDKFTKIGSASSIPTTNFVLRTCTENALTILDSIRAHEEQNKKLIKLEIEQERKEEKEKKKLDILTKNKDKLEKGRKLVKKKKSII